MSKSRGNLSWKFLFLELLRVLVLWTNVNVWWRKWGGIVYPMSLSRYKIPVSKVREFLNDVRLIGLEASFIELNRYVDYSYGKLRTLLCTDNHRNQLITHQPCFEPFISSVDVSLTLFLLILTNELFNRKLIDHSWTEWYVPVLDNIRSEWCTAADYCIPSRTNGNNKGSYIQKST